MDGGGRCSPTMEHGAPVDVRSVAHRCRKRSAKTGQCWILSDCPDAACDLAEKQAGELKLRKSHAGSEAGLDRMRQMFERSAGVYPAAEVRAERQKIKQKAKQTAAKKKGH
jgi:hypothetical protein